MEDDELIKKLKETKAQRIKTLEQKKKILKALQAAKKNKPQ